MIENRAEFRESLKYETRITIHRHGPKIGIDGPLSEEGKAVVADYFDNAYENIPLATGNITIEYSPIHRAKESAIIYKNSLLSQNPRTSIPLKEDARLSEGGIAENKEVLDGLFRTYGRGGKWIYGWLKMEDRPTPEIKTGSEAVADFSGWILDKIHHVENEGGKQEVDAFSHGPVILAFLITIEEKMKENILPENWTDKNIFATLLDYLSSIQILHDSNSPNEIEINFAHQKHIVPLEVIEELGQSHNVKE